MNCFFGHKFGKWEDYNENCSLYQKRYCYKCNKVDIQFIKINHDYSQWDIYKSEKTKTFDAYSFSQLPYEIEIVNIHKRYCKKCNNPEYKEQRSKL